eukprot:Rmarinus@m.17997
MRVIVLAFLGISAALATEFDVECFIDDEDPCHSPGYFGCPCIESRSCCPESFPICLFDSASGEGACMSESESDRDESTLMTSIILIILGASVLLASCFFWKTCPGYVWRKRLSGAKVAQQPVLVQPVQVAYGSPPLAAVTTSPSLGLPPSKPVEIKYVTHSNSARQVGPGDVCTPISIPSSPQLVEVDYVTTTR